MNAENLIRHYERVADTTHTVARLRRFVLDLAVRGKLVPQDANDGPASKLLTRIAAEKSRLGVSTAAVPISADEMPFPLPPGWSWSRIGEVCSKTGSGSTPRGGQAAYKSFGVPFLRSQNIYDDGLRLSDVAYIDDNTHARMVGTQLRPKDLLLNITGGSIGRCCRVPDNFGEANVSQHVAIIRLAVPAMSDYLHRLVLSPYFQRYVDGEQTGAGRGGLPKGRMDQIAVAVPPLAEQHRIVAKIDELMALCNRLEAARAEREAVRDRLVAASLARLNAPDPESFADDARFALDALPALTARADQIKQLRQAILTLAIRGKLVRQDLADGPAIPFDPDIPADTAYPFDLPPTWHWARLKALGKLRGGGTPSKAREDFWNGSIPWVSPKDMKRDYISATQLSITPAALANSATGLIEAGSVLFVVRGMILVHSFPVAVNQVPLAINQDMKALVLNQPDMAEFVLRALKALKPAMLARVQRSTHGTCRLEGDDYSDFLVPVPPPAEQRRIVGKVDELMATCDELESSLKAAAEHRSLLLAALLRDALESGGHAVGSAASTETTAA